MYTNTHTTVCIARLSTVHKFVQLWHSNIKSSEYRVAANDLTLRFRCGLSHTSIVNYLIFCHCCAAVNWKYFHSARNNELDKVAQISFAGGAKCAEIKMNSMWKKEKVINCKQNADAHVWLVFCVVASMFVGAFTVTVIGLHFSLRWVCIHQRDRLIRSQFMDVCVCVCVACAERERDIFCE